MFGLVLMEYLIYFSCDTPNSKVSVILLYIAFCGSKLVYAILNYIILML